MSTLQLDSALLQKAERQARLRNVDLNELVADFIRRFIGKEGKEEQDATTRTAAPCCYSVTELVERTRRGVSEARRGEGKTTEELMKEASTW